jgi:outer membrane protein
MNTLIRLTISLLVLATVLTNPNPSFAAEKTRDIKMGILDVERVTRQSLMAKDIARQIDAQRRKFMGEIKKEETSLRKSDDELQKQRVILSPEAFADEARKFRLKTTTLRKKVQNRNQELSRLRSIANRELQGAIQKALTQVTKRQRYNLVLRYTPQVILVRPDYLDISKSVLDQLNKNVSKYTIPTPAAKPGK